MPELQEVFRMATQKVDQEPGALERQVARQHKAARNRRVGAFAAAAVLIVMAVAAYALTRTAPPGTPAHSTPIPIQDASGSMLDLRTGKLTPLPASIAYGGDYFAASPDHQTIAFNPCCTSSGPLYTANIDGTQLHQVSLDPQDGYAAQWSPDGSKLVYQQRDGASERLGNLFVYDVATGQHTRVTNLDQRHSSGYWAMLPSFSADGQSVLFQLPRGALPGNNNPSEDLWSVPVTGGTQTLVRRNAESGYYSPDGKWLLYRSATQNRTWITSVQGGTPRLVARGDIGWLRWSPDATRISYSENGSIYVLDVATGKATRVADGGNAEWFDNNTLIVAHPST
jgi:Tol biopolymer transport system component